MKYIRTEKGIYETDNIIAVPMENGTNEVFFKKKNDKLCINKNQVIAQADTIEELCDEFVIFDEINNCCMEIDSSYSSVKNNGWVGSNFTIYGAIWTDKGLIYVAKMNDKGELVLI